MREKGIIRPLISSYAAPVCAMRKRDGTLRLCIDYRALNAKTMTSNVAEVLDNLEKQDISVRLILPMDIIRLRSVKRINIRLRFVCHPACGNVI